MSAGGEQLEGRVEAFPAAPAQSFVAAGRTVTTDGSTVFTLNGSSATFAAIAIGLLLLLVAGSLAKANVSLLIGKSVSPSIEAQFRQEIAGLDQVSDVPVLLTTVIGPGQLIVMAKVDFDDTATVADIERASDEAERRLVARHEGVRYVFLDPTRGDGRARAEAHRLPVE